jgi:excinuclease ABC subunit A
MSGMIKGLRDAGNTVLMVEQSPAMLAISDRVVELGPSGGAGGGTIIADGPPAAASVQARCEHKKTSRILRPGLEVRGACANNLRNADVDIPCGGLIALTGVSGSGKTSLAAEVIHASWLKGGPANCAGFRVAGDIAQMVMVEQDIPPAAGPGIPATFLGIFEPIRDMYAASAAAKERGWKAGHFSFLSRDGRCPDCEGSGFHEISMDYWTDVRALCETCRGSRYRREIAEATVDGVSIPELLKLPLTGLRPFLEKNLPPKGREKVLRIADLAEKTGLGYLSAGQPLHTLSDGELQRLKLASGMAEGKTAKTLYLLDEPTGGLHHKDITRLLTLFDELIAEGGSILCITHEPLLIQAADRLIEVGPGPGRLGGKILRS